MSWMALPRPSRSNVVTLGDAVTGLLDTPVGKNVLLLVQRGAWNDTDEAAQAHAQLPNYAKTGPVWGDNSVPGIATCITDWMLLDGRNVDDASWMPVQSLAQNVVTPTVDPPAGPFSVVDQYFQSAAGLWEVVRGNPSQVTALRHIDWSVPFSAMPWDWLRAHAATVDWPIVLSALQANPNASNLGKATERKHDFGNFGLFGWQKTIEGASLTWAEVPYELFSLPGFSDAAKRYPWWLPDFATQEGSAAALLGAIGLAAPPQQQATAFPTSGQSPSGTPLLTPTRYIPGVVGLVNPKQPIQPGLIRTTVGAQNTAAIDTGSGVGWWLAGGAALATAVAIGMRKKKGRK